MKTIIVIPTYNEIDNVGKMIDTLLSLDEKFEVLIVDDSSPDGTGEFVQKKIETNNRVHLVVNEKKAGIGPAYIRGFTEALKLSPDYIVQMDCDFSHDPNTVPKMLEKAIEDGADLVIGSRYISGISVLNWSIWRLLLSYFANIYVRIVLGMKVYDTTGGFKCFKASSLARLNMAEVKSAGYSFQIEMNYAFEKNKFKISEVPIIFGERESGESKMSGNIIKEALLRVLGLKFRNIKKYFKGE